MNNNYNVQAHSRWQKWSVIEELGGDNMDQISLEVYSQIFPAVPNQPGQFSSPCIEGRLKFDVNLSLYVTDI